ncbi:putative HLH transcription factor [Aspergillus steynii IBT 23096]|uniref:Putative HLH transcription factor n=1 Tax=Aspergillus steynii IBT 23096 TaxID=1392250 RepID=A0A2I2G4L5_9EURO|nr:putative HLH transcription factor [Aspergillus steynii IBT 23096]PLB47817.1 putative HLH transcription factor [Aspergillus steynii IBT 23096]
MNMNGSEPQNGRNSPQPGPFGYSFLSPMDTPYEPAPAPPPGPALLDDQESNMLDSFFTTMNSNQFTNEFWLQGNQNKSFGPTNFEWSTEMPPTFEGSTTSLSQPSVPQHGLEKPGFGVMPNNMGTSSDIFAAASMLYHNGMNGTEFNTGVGHHPFPTFPDVDLSNVRSHSSGKAEQHTDHMPAKPVPSRPRVPSGFHTSEMLFDVREPISVEQQAIAKVRPLHWGSDISFMDQGYVAPPDQPNEEEQTKELLDHLDCFERQSSAANTRAPSPERTLGGHGASWTGSNAVGQPSDLRREYRDDNSSQPKKKQRTLVKEEEDDENSDIDSSNPKSRRSRASSYNRSRRMSSDTIRKSRLSQSAKAARENLTEEQKRSNHILSEQKRRNLIRQGFDDLCSLVPGLKGGGFSKSAMLTQAADWLEEVLQGNEILKAQLSELNTMNGLVMPR